MRSGVSFGGRGRRGWSPGSAGLWVVRRGPSRGRWTGCARADRRRCTAARRTHPRRGGSRRRRRGAVGGCRVGRTQAHAGVAGVGAPPPAPSGCPGRPSAPPPTSTTTTPEVRRSTAVDASTSSDAVAPRRRDADVSVYPLRNTTNTNTYLRPPRRLCVVSCGQYVNNMLTTRGPPPWSGGFLQIGSDR